MKDEKCLKCGLSNYELKNSKGNAGTYCTWCAATEKAEASKREKILQEKLTEAQNLLSKLPKTITKDGVEVLAYVSTLWFLTPDGKIVSSHKWTKDYSRWFIDFGTDDNPFERCTRICYSSETAVLAAYDEFRAKNEIKDEAK